ncbi:MAG: type IV pilin protein [Lysobacter sp.]
MTSNRTRKRASGFTLIELMIVVAVVAILAAVAYPSYADYVRKSRRGQAKADLMELTQLLERYRTVNNSYEDFNMEAFEHSPHDGTSYYSVELLDADRDSYSLVATPMGSQIKDTKCGALSITQAGRKDIGADATSTVERCW